MNTFFLTDLITPNADISAIMPELIVAIAGIAAMVYDSFFPKHRGVTAGISLIGLAASAVALMIMWSPATIAALNPKPTIIIAAPAKSKAGKFGSAIFKPICVILVEPVAP